MNAVAYLRLLAFGVCLLLLDWTQATLADDSATSNISHVWANNGEDKVTRDDLRAQRDSVVNSVWDGTHISLFAGRNETVAFNPVLEAGKQTASLVAVTFDRLVGPDGATISSTTNEDLFDFRGRNIELFFNWTRFAAGLPLRGGAGKS